nr:MAG TPA: hypothetical protein [Caudoviricetes sp.]
MNSMMILSRLPDIPRMIDAELKLQAVQRRNVHRQVNLWQM